MSPRTGWLPALFVAGLLALSAQGWCCERAVEGDGPKPPGVGLGPPAPTPCPVVGDEGDLGSGLRYRPEVDLPITLAAAVVAKGLAAGQKKQDIRACSWCDRDEAGHDSLNAFDAWGRRTLKWETTGSAKRASNVGLGLSIVFPAVLTAWRRDTAPGWTAVGDAALILESVAVTGALTQVGKVVFRRERPFVHFGDVASHTPESNDNWSHPSGHASMSFAAVVSAGVIAHRRDSRQERWIWLVGLPVAGATSYLRVASDQHYLSDVLAGAATGGLVGLVVPRLHFRGSKGEAGLGPCPQGGGLQVTLSWR